MPEDELPPWATIAAPRRVLPILAAIGGLGFGIYLGRSVTGDDVLAPLVDRGLILEETDRPAAELGDRLISARAYTGAAPILEAFDAGADIVITGRASDPAMFLAPQIHASGWAMDDWNRLGRGTVIGHLLECAGQITGGGFADPRLKDVAGRAELGFPLAEVEQDGSAVITKVSGSGGLVTRATCIEQLLYEIQGSGALSAA